jgi:uncharacterized membrane protein
MLAMVTMLTPHFMLPENSSAHVEILLRTIHFIAGITWVGLLYFFNLVNIPFMKELDASLKPKVVPNLMPKALWWFRWSSVLTVFAGVWYWMIIIGANRRAAEATGEAVNSGGLIGSFFGIWTIVAVLMVGIFMMGKLNNSFPALAVVFTILIVGAAWLFLSINSHGWETNRVLSIGIGGGLGWVMMMNVWGIIWRAQKKLIAWTSAGQAPPEMANWSRMALVASRTNFVLSFPMLFFMAAASHYPIFGN